MAKKRLTRKQLLKEPDEFITTAGRVVQWARNNTRSLVYGCAGFFGVVILIAAWSYYQDRQAKLSAALLGQATAKYQSALADGQADKALDAVRGDFKRLIDAYGGQPAGRLGRLAFAHFCLAAGAYDDAVMQYQKALADFSDDPSLLNIILNGLGSALQQKGEDNLAVPHYERLISADSSMLKDAALFNLGVLYGRQGKMEKVKAVYERLVADFPDSVYAGIAREQL